MGGGATLALGGGAGTFTLAALAAEYTGFGRYRVLAGANWTLTGSNTLASGAAPLSNSGTLTNTGKLVVNGALTNSGTLMNTGRLTDNTALTNGGTVEIGGHGALDLVDGATAKGSIAFDGAGALLEIGAAGAPAGVSGRITNFFQGETIDVAGIGLAASYAYAGNLLTLRSSGGATLARLNLSTEFLHPAFTLATDGNGGTDITVGPSRTAVPITGTVNHSVTLTTVGAYASPMTIAASGSVPNNGTGDAISGPGTNAWTVVNYGRVTATAGYAGVGLKAGGSVTNGSISQKTALIAGGAGSAGTAKAEQGGAGGAGISLPGGGSIGNTGTIEGGIGGGGYFDGVGGTGGAGIGLTGRGYIANSGTIAGGLGGAGGVDSDLSGSAVPSSP